MDYNPATDILSVEYPDLDAVHISIIKENLRVMVQTIKNYDIKKLLLNASHTKVNVSEAQSREISLQLANELKATRLEKLARVQPVDPMREKLAQANIAEMMKSGGMPYQLQTFSSHQHAMAWLLG